MDKGRFSEELESGKYAWPGGYPKFFVTDDGGCLSFESAKENRSLIEESIDNGSNDGWRVVDVDINWEDTELTCDHSGETIESAYRRG